jgi:hypothetical protein
LAVAKPVDCTHVTAWRTFTSPKWPVSFQYPDHWRIAEKTYAPAGGGYIGQGPGLIEQLFLVPQDWLLLHYHDGDELAIQIARSVRRVAP